ncbi:MULTISPECIES: hypothetical protein [Mesorhizobium]|nr:MULTISPECIES: hypothetical protein [Mesorhizobium]
MDKVTGDGHAELLDDGSIEITFETGNFSGVEYRLLGPRSP